MTSLTLLLRGQHPRHRPAHPPVGAAGGDGDRAAALQAAGETPGAGGGGGCGKNRHPLRRGQAQAGLAGEEPVAPVVCALPAGGRPGFVGQLDVDRCARGPVDPGAVGGDLWGLVLLFYQAHSAGGL